MIFLIENPFNEFLKENAIWIALSFASIIILTLLTVFFFALKQRSKAHLISFDASSFLNALGGHDNLVKSEALGSRLTVYLKEKKLLDEVELKHNGVLSIIKMSDKIVLVVDGQAEKYNEKLTTL